MGRRCLYKIEIKSYRKKPKSQILTNSESKHCKFTNIVEIVFEIFRECPHKIGKLIYLGHFVSGIVIWS